jgi:hypothetical protein
VFAPGGWAETALHQPERSAMNEPTGEERDEEPLEPEANPGLVGGGGPAAAMDDLPGPDDEERHLEDTDH